MTLRRNVYELTQRRLENIFAEFDNVYLSFSGGKDSGVLLNLCIDYIRSHRLNRRIGVLHLDYEAQYTMTTEYVDRTLSQNRDILEIYRICVPFKVPTCASMYQSYWRPWEASQRELWVRRMPEGCYTEKDFPFYDTDMWDYEFQFKFGEWLHRQKKAKRTCCLVGIRTQESLNRWRTIYRENVYSKFMGLKWTKKLYDNIYNVYPIYDWQTTDVWTANGKFGWDYNRLYDLFYKAGVSLDKQRVASPFISPAQESLHLYRVIDPNTWGRLVGRVNGVNFLGLYGGTTAVGWQSVKLPEGHTWKSYMYFLLSTLPEAARKNYLEKLAVSMDFWRRKGGCLSDETIRKLRDAGIPITVMADTNYKTSKKPVRMEYIDDIDIPEFKEIPTFKRMCICILKNDHACKYMGFALNKSERERKERIMEKYKELL
ncbi:MAG: DUF3440 domain-containing protein [Coprobacter sp.]|nr:DUF3440 domain-containing protein [Coprobacter sp.]